MSIFLSHKSKLTPTPAEVEARLEKVVQDVRERLLPFMEEDFSGDYKTQEARQFAVSRMMGTNPEAPDLTTANFGGYCGHAQYFADVALKAQGLKPHWHTFEKPSAEEDARKTHIAGVMSASKSLNGKAAHNHVALTVEVDTTEGKKYYLIEPTFKQFCKGGEQSPGSFIENGTDGDYLRERLERVGVLELTPQRASAYVAAFCNGSNPLTSITTMDFLTTQPDLRQSRGPFPPKAYLDSKISGADAEKAAPPAVSAASSSPRRQNVPCLPHAKR